VTDWTLVASALVSIFAAGAYGYVAIRLYQRAVSPGSKLALAQFSLWWGGLGASSAFGALEALLAFGGLLTLPLAIAFSLFVVLIDVIFLWGLTGFLTYVYTGRYYLVPLSAFYALFYFAALYYEILGAPYAVAVQAGSPTLLAHTVHNPVLIGFVLLGLLVPEIAAAILYLTLLRRTHDPAQRYRIVLVGSSILLWFGILAFVPSTTVGWTLTKGVLEVVPALLSLIAYQPPAGIRRRLLLSESPADAPPAPAAGPSAGP
jgi:hypothetical protein